MTVKFLNPFRQRWLEEFREAASYSNRRQRRNWDAYKAFLEIQKAGCLPRVFPPNGEGQPFNDLTYRLHREIRAYERCSVSIDGTNRCFNDALDSLDAASKGLRNPHLEMADVKSHLDDFLANAASLLDAQKNRLKRQIEYHWEDRLLASTEEMRQWSPQLDVDTKNLDWISYGRQAVPSEVPADLAEWATRFNEFNYPVDLKRRIDLDSRTQVRLAVVLRYYLDMPSKITRTTIARLVLLASLCGGIAERVADESGGKVLVMGHSMERLTVGPVVQRLQEAGLK